MIHNAAGSLSRLQMTDDDAAPAPNGTGSRKSSASSGKSMHAEEKGTAPPPVKEDEEWEDER